MLAWVLFLMVAVSGGDSLAALPPSVGQQLFENAAEEQAFFLWQGRENRFFGGDQNIRRYNTTPMQGTVFMQRSGRHRLYDHNIILAALYAGRIAHAKLGNLGPQFEQGIFIDLGSAILFQEGAPTVRDVWEDPRIRPHLAAVIATDIEDPGSPATRYISIYRATRNNLPFPVLEIDLRMVESAQFTGLLRQAEARMASADRPVVFRAANTGPDLFYSDADVRQHLRAIARACEQRDVIYFFSKYVLFKPRGSLAYQVLGEIDPNVGVYHSADVWTRIDWTRRTLRESFVPNPSVVRISP